MCRPCGWTLALVVALVSAVVSGCSGPEKASEGVEKSVVHVSGVAHAPVLVAPDEVRPGGMLRGWAEAASGPVLVQAMLEGGRIPVGESAEIGRRRTDFAFPVPADASGNVIVRAIDREGLFTEKIIVISGEPIR